MLVRGQGSLLSARSLHSTRSRPGISNSARTATPATHADGSGNDKRDPPCQGHAHVVLGQRGKILLLFSQNVYWT